MGGSQALTHAKIDSDIWLVGKYSSVEAATIQDMAIERVVF